MTAAFAGLMTLAVAGVLRVPRANVRAWCAARADLVGLLAGGLLLCAVQRPLLQHHLVVVGWPLALLAASAIPSATSRGTLVAAGLGLGLIVPWVGHGRDTLGPSEMERARHAASVVRTIAGPGRRVVSDLPIVPLLAGRPAAPQTADPSYVRVATGSLSRRVVLAAAEGTGAVVVGRAFTGIPGLERELARRYGAPRVVDGLQIYATRR
jgi:hypothetical protein